MNLFKKGDKLYSIFNFKCPKCHEGDFFIDKKAIKLKSVTKIHDNCPSCNLKYMMEPSFFYGAMYVGYAITVAMSIAIFILTTVIFKQSLLTSFIGVVGVLILSAPYTLKLSRIIWINIFVNFEDKKSNS